VASSISLEGVLVKLLFLAIGSSKQAPTHSIGTPGLVSFWIKSGALTSGKLGGIGNGELRLVARA
jgi:hypothetical protein